MNTSNFTRSTTVPVAQQSIQSSGAKLFSTGMLRFLDLKGSKLNYCKSCDKLFEQKKVEISKSTKYSTLIVVN